jgi:hypothetical protein
MKSFTESGIYMENVLGHSIKGTSYFEITGRHTKLVA